MMTVQEDDDRWTYWLYFDAVDRWFPTAYPMTLDEATEVCEQVGEICGVGRIYLALAEGEHLVGMHVDGERWIVDDTTPCPKPNDNKDLN